MASMMVRSSSVSAPSISSLICFWVAWDMSRTTRGSLFQTVPMGCMRVFITPSCSSEVIRFRCCELAPNAASAWRMAYWRIWLRESTSSPTRFISLSSIATSTRMVESATEGPFGAVPGSASAVGLGASAGALSSSTTSSGAASSSSQQRRLRRGLHREVGEPTQPPFQILVRNRRLVAGGLDDRQLRRHDVRAFKNQGNQFRRQVALAVAELAQDVLGDVRQAFELGQPKKSRSPFNGVERAENARQKFRVFRPGLDGYQVLVQAAQVFIGFDDEFRKNLLVLYHACSGEDTQGTYRAECAESEKNRRLSLDVQVVRRRLS